jgi:hypothetical protein
MEASQRRYGGCWCGFSTLNGAVERRSEMLCSGLGVVLDDERKAAGKPTYFTAVVVVAM